VGRRTAVGVLACALLLAGCAAEHEASTTLPPVSDAAAATSSSAAALPAVGPADFPVPMEARQHTPTGALAFTRYYIELMNRQAATLDSQPLRDLSRKCETCEDLAQSYEETKAAGHHFRGGEITVVSMGGGLVHEGTSQTSFLLAESPTTIVDSSGAPVEVRSSAGKRLTGGAILWWDADRSTWLMAQLDANPV